MEIPSRDKQGEITGWQSVSTQDELFSHLVKQNKAHFAQGKDTPFVNGVFGTQIHPFAQNKFSEEILDGSVDLKVFIDNNAIKF